MKNHPSCSRQNWCGLGSSENDLPVLIRNPTGDFREASRGSSALTGITRVDVAVNAVFKRRQF